MQDDIRLSKLMAHLGLCSRREADELIEKGLVLVDGKVVDTLGQKVSPHSKITLNQKALKFKSSKVTILLNKPVGIVSCQPEKGYKSAIELISRETQDKNDKKAFKKEHLKKLSVAGRLDINSKGLLVLTQDGHIAKQLIGENSEIEKEYFVRVRESLTPLHIQKLSGKMSLDGKLLKKVFIEQKTDHSFHITLLEGRKRQIRRMCEKVGLSVSELKRIRIGKVSLKGLKLGTWRYLLDKESFT